MSWNFKKVGTPRRASALKASVQSEVAPKAVKDEICQRIDDIAASPNHVSSAILVESHGHLGADDRPFEGVDTVVIRVQTLPFINGPAESGN